MKHPYDIIDKLSDLTGEVLLFHSATGKDSIAILDMLYNRIESITCVFMPLVSGLEYENNYIRWAERKYPGVKFIETPHYALNSFIRNGYLGIKKDPSISKTSISKIDDKIRRATGVNWSVYGFKKIDGLTRRLMLNPLEDGTNHTTQKCYPLKDWKNKDVLSYISDNHLIPPFNYGTKKPSSGCDISTPEFLSYLKKVYPADLQKIFEQFPLAEAILFKFEQYGKE